MTISLIAACDLQMTIGKDGDLPWHLPADLRFFMHTTMGKPMIMGRRTFDTLPGPLKGRLNIVLTRNEEFAPDGVTVAHTVDEALQSARRAEPNEEIMILGGSTIFERFLPDSDRFYLTVIHERFEGGDTFFPAFDLSQWEISSVEHHDPDAENAYPYSFFVLERAAPKPVAVQSLNEPRELPAELRQR
jgi:dihydrofolate reductase